MKNKIKLKKALNKVEQPFLIQSKSQLTDSKAFYQGSSESKTADSGRSMVEMLGVLAVVGVLSVGGILGYKYAMNKYQANQIVNELNLTSSQMAIMLMRPHTADFELSLGEPYDDGRIATNALAFDFGCGAGGAGEDANCTADDIEYFSEVQGLPKEVCQNLVQLAQNLPYLEEVLVNDVADETGALCAENNTVRCLFNADQNALIDDNPDPEETETESDDGFECNGHGILSDFGCSCDAGWYDSAGEYYEASNCAMDQKAANQKFCNGKGQWARSDDGYTGYGLACQCDDGSWDNSNNECRGNGGCCKNAGLHTTIASTTTQETTTTPEITMTPEVSVSGDSRCGPHGKFDGSSCYCDSGWYDIDGLYFGTTANCALSQAGANEKYCNNRGTWSGGRLLNGCICNNDTRDSSNNRCRGTGGCCNGNFCTSNSNCKSGEYCYADAYSCSQEFGDSKTGGLCKTASGTTKEISGLGTVIKSNDPLTWWSAERFCQSLGKRMVLLADLGCTTSRCNNSQIVKDLYSAFGFSYIWTSDQDSGNCSAYYVDLSDGRVSTNRRTSSYSALCK